MGLFGANKKEDVHPTHEVQARLPPSKADPAAQPYGIDKAIELMRTLPSDEASIGLVVQVMRRTLESLNVNVENIAGDAMRKQAAIEERIEQLGREVSALQSEIRARENETAQLRLSHEEVTRIKDRLMMARKPAASSDAAPVQAAGPKARSLA